MTFAAWVFAISAGLAPGRPQDPPDHPEAPVEWVLNEASRAAAEKRWDDAKALAASAVARSIRDADPALEAHSRRLLGRILLDRGELDLAREELARAARHDEEIDAAADLAHDLKWLGHIEFRKGRYASALTLYERSRASAADAGIPAPVSRAEMGALLSNLGRYEEARAEIAAVLDEAAAAGRGAEHLYALTALGSLESARGDYAEAVRLFLAAVDAARSAEDAPSEASTLVLLAGVWSELARDADAEDALARSLELLDAGRDPLQHAYALLTLALARLDADLPKTAAEPLRLALSEMEAAGHEVGVVDALELEARLHGALGRHDEAESAWREVASRREALGDAFRAALALAALGETLEARGRRVEARELFERALARSTGHPAAAWRARAGLARDAEAAGRRSEALELYDAAIRTVEGMRSRIGSASLRSRFLSAKLDVYRRAAVLAARAGELERAFRWTEAAKARTLLEIRSQPAEVRAAAPDRIRDAESALAFCEMRFAEALQRRCEDDTRTAFERRLAAARAELEAARLQVEVGSPRSSALLGLREPPTLAEVRAAIPQDAAILDYVIGGSASGVWIIDRAGARFVELDAVEVEIEPLVDALHRPVVLLRAGRADLANLRFEAEAAEELHRRLVAPIREAIQGKASLWIVPDGSLWRLPFSLLVVSREKRPVDPALANAQYAGCRFLVEDFALACLPSAALAVDGIAPEDSRAASGASIVVSDPAPLPADEPRLPGARAEAEAASAHLPGPSVRLVGEFASEARLKAETRSPRWLHLATHAWLDDRRPIYSRLALAPGGGEDGWLHAFEVERMSLAGTSVVLSACDTAGEPLRGEGLLGLARAFLWAGARSVVATRWAIDDEASAHLVERYYDALAQGAGAPQALRAAQIDTMRRGGREGLSYVHPFFWAAFVHVGSPR